MTVAQSSQLAQLYVKRAHTVAHRNFLSLRLDALRGARITREVFLCYVLKLYQNESGKGARGCHRLNAYRSRQEGQLKGDHNSGAAQDVDALAQAPTSGLGLYRPHVQGSGGQEEQ